MIDLLYVAYNRIAYTRESFDALLENTDWNEVETLYVHDDGSEDGTRDYLAKKLVEFGVISSDRPDAIVFHDERLGGPIAAMNWYLDSHVARAAELEAAGQPKVESWAKIDNDFVVCPGWLNDLLATMTRNPGLDVLGIEPMIGPPTSCPSPRTVTDARHIGGKGIIRHRTFEGCRPVPRRNYFGWTEFQKNHPGISKGWATPDLPCFGLDQLPLEPWRSLAAEYEEAGWGRRWPEYDELTDGYWSWWEPRHLG